MIVFAVVYSNYEPDEVDSLWLHEEAAKKRRDKLNSDTTVSNSDNWEVRPRTVHEDIT